MTIFASPSHTGRMTSLPRDSRDTLWLLGVLAWTLAPQLLRVPGWCAAFALAALLWRAVLAWRQRPLPPREVLVVALVTASVGVLWQYRTLLGKEAGITLLVLLTALKTLELRARRDAMVVFFIGFVCVLANFLYSQSLPLAAGMLVSVIGLLAALAQAHMPGGRPSWRQATGLALASALRGAPLVVVLFLFFPRFSPLWGTPGDAGGRTGLSDTLELGQVAELASDDTLALRVRFDGPVPAPQDLYFRGPVLRLYDGRRWWADDGGVGPAARRRGLPERPELHLQLDRPVTYEMTVEPLRVATLPLLEITPQAPRVVDGDLALMLRQDLHWQPQRPLTDRWRLVATAYLDATYDPGQTGLTQQEDLDLPAGRHPRTRAWARGLAARRDLQGADARRLAEATLAHIRTAGFTYTLSPGMAGGDPIDDFWLDRHEGFCEHFASAFVVIMRALGVPARIVTGYQGGQVNPVDGWLEVRQSDAHAWAEYWSRDSGWVRADPTSAVAPDRIRRDLRLAPAAGLVARTMGRFDALGLARLRFYWSAMDHRWNRWVLNYTRNSQFELLRQAGWSSPDLLDLLRSLLGGLGLLGLAGAAWAAWDGRRQQAVDPWLRTYRGVQQALAGRGLALPASTAPRTLAAAVRHRWGDAGQALARHLETLDQARYGTGGTPPPLRAYRRQLQALATRLPRLTAPAGP